jgi:alpha,alpha-trehalase
LLIFVKILQTVNIAQPFADPKTFVDKPTSRSSNDVVSAFNSTLAADGDATDVTIQQVVDFVENNFRGEGLELEALVLPGFQDSPAFLGNVTDPLINAWSQAVHSFWTQLARGTDETQICGLGAGDCESTLIPLNHTFVVPGGRFREQCMQICRKRKFTADYRIARLLGQLLDCGRLAHV